MDLIPAVAYRRVSTADQSDNGFSLPKQQEYIERYAREHGLDIVADIAEDVSGMTPIEEHPNAREPSIARPGRTSSSSVSITSGVLCRPQ